MLVAQGYLALHQAAIEIGEFRLQLSRLLIQQGNLAELFGLGLHEFALGFSNNVWLIEKLHFRKGTSILQLVEAIQNFRLELQIVLQHQNLFLFDLHGFDLFLLF